MLEEASPLVSKPNCIMNVIIVILLAILVYFIVRKLLGDSETDTAWIYFQHIDKQRIIRWNDIVFALISSFERQRFIL